MKDEPRSPRRHQLDHAVPTVIHHPEEDLPQLARWLHRAMENQTRFWGLIVGLVVVVIGLTVLTTGFSLGRSTSDEAWMKLETAKTAAERVEIAKEFPKSQAERWALLQAATEYYNQGFADLPSNRDVALPALKKALDLFERVENESDPASFQARVAALGVARTLEARNELDKAIQQYEKVARTWKDSEEGRQAKQLARLLRRPESVAFYKELYAYKASEATLPPLGQEGINLPPNHPPLDSPTVPASLLPPPPPSPPASPLAPAASGTGQPSLPGLPSDIFAPVAPETKAEAPKTALPSDVFAPKTKGDMPKP
jgi:tetratricopeptide (TPR) repeat protein